MTKTRSYIDKVLDRPPRDLRRRGDSSVVAEGQILPPLKRKRGKSGPSSVVAEPRTKGPSSVVAESRRKARKVQEEPEEEEEEEEERHAGIHDYST